MGNRHKGALTSNFMQWLLDLLAKVRPDPDGLLRQCRVVTYRLNFNVQCAVQGGCFPDRGGVFIYFNAGSRVFAVLRFLS